MATILITAATSALGQDVVRHLLTRVKPSTIAVSVRDKTKVPTTWTGIDVRVADYNEDAAKWAETLSGIERVLLISGTDLGARVQQHSNVIQGSKKAGVKLIAYTSILEATTSALPLAFDHAKTEAELRSSGIPYIFLRNGWYTENVLRHKAGWEQGTQASSAGDSRFSTAARDDYAEAAALVLAPGYQGTNQVLELAGDDSFSYAELTKFVSEKLGKPVAVNELPQPAHEELLIGFGFPQVFANLLSVVDVEAKKGGLEDSSKTLSKLLGRPTVPWRETVAAGLA